MDLATDGAQVEGALDAKNDVKNVLTDWLAARIAALPATEQQVVAWCLERVVTGLEVGLERYGALDLLRDQRHFPAEATAELRDALIYFACASLRRRMTAEGSL